MISGWPACLPGTPCMQESNDQGPVGLPPLHLPPACAIACPPDRCTQQHPVSLHNLLRRLVA